MDSLKYKYAMKDLKPEFTTANETTVTSPTVSFATAAGERSRRKESEGVFSPRPSTSQSSGTNKLFNSLPQQEPKKDSDLTPEEIRQLLMIYQRNNKLNMSKEKDPKTDNFLDNAPGGSTRPRSVPSSNRRSDSVGAQANRTEDMMDSFDFLTMNNSPGGSTRPKSVPSSNRRSDSVGAQAIKSEDMMNTFDFLIKSLSSANNYVSMLNREQLSVLRCIRPSLLYELLLDVTQIYSDKRMKQTQPTECGFCKNNGEDNWWYSQHVLKDPCGRVQCPVLRTFKCTRCGATGDHAHTLKYCPENVEGDRSTM